MLTHSEKLRQRSQRVAALAQEPSVPQSSSETWIAHEWCNAFTGAGATNIEGSSAEEWDAVACSRPPTNLAQAKLVCEQDPYCEGFTFDPAKLVYWKLRSIEPAGFKQCRGYRYDVYVKESAARIHAGLIAQAKLRAEEAAADAAKEASLKKNFSGAWRGLASAPGLGGAKDLGKEDNAVEVAAPESVIKPAIAFESVYEGEKPKKVAKAKAKAPIANIFGEVEEPKKKFVGLGDDAPSATLGKGGRSRSRSPHRRRH